MRRALVAVLSLVLLVAAPMEAATAGKKRSKRAKVHRTAARASAERLVDLTLPVAPVPEDPGPGPALPSFVSVAAREFSLTLSRPLVAAGDVRIELRNNGEDPHNLVVSPDGTHTPLAAFSELDPGLYERRTVALAPGRYQLWCSLEFHEGLGMSVTLRVDQLD
jgi:plastocyanin